MLKMWTNKQRNKCIKMWNVDRDYVLQNAVIFTCSGKGNE